MTTTTAVPTKPHRVRVIWLVLAILILSITGLVLSFNMESPILTPRGILVLILCGLPFLWCVTVIVLGFRSSGVGPAIKESIGNMLIVRGILWTRDPDQRRVLLAVFKTVVEKQAQQLQEEQRKRTLCQSQ